MEVYVGQVQVARDEAAIDPLQIQNSIGVSLDDADRVETNHLIGLQYDEE